MSQKNSLTWFITGCSTGFGRELARVVVARGYRAAVTARDPKQVADLVAGHEDRTLALRLDVTDPAQVAESVQRAEERFGGIDVLVNNAGIGYFAARHGITPQTEHFPMSRINEAFERLRAGKARYRIVLDADF